MRRDVVLLLVFALLIPISALSGQQERQMVKLALAGEEPAADVLGYGNVNEWGFLPDTQNQ